MTRTHQGLLLLALAASTSMAGAQDTTAKKLYCWNEGGRKVCGDALPASAVDGARTEISRSGLQGDRINRTPTLQEREMQAAQEAERRAQAAQAAADQRRDMALAESYDSEDQLRKAFNIRYEMVDESIKSAKMGIVNQRRSLLTLLNAASDAELGSTGKVPDKLARNVMTQRASVVEAQAALNILQHERAGLDAQLAQALARYRKAKGLDEATPASTPAAPEAPAATGSP